MPAHLPPSLIRLIQEIRRVEQEMKRQGRSPNDVDDIDDPNGPVVKAYHLLDDTGIDILNVNIVNCLVRLRRYDASVFGVINRDSDGGLISDIALEALEPLDETGLLNMDFFIFIIDYSYSFSTRRRNPALVVTPTEMALFINILCLIEEPITRDLLREVAQEGIPLISRIMVDRGILTVAQLRNITIEQYLLDALGMVANLYAADQNPISNDTLGIIQQVLVDDDDVSSAYLAVVRLNKAGILSQNTFTAISPDFLSEDMADCLIYLANYGIDVDGQIPLIQEYVGQNPIPYCVAANNPQYLDELLKHVEVRRFRPV